MTRVRQKVSGCFRGMAGAGVFRGVRSYISTFRELGHNAIAHLVNCFDYHNCPMVMLPLPVQRGAEQLH